MGRYRTPRLWTRKIFPHILNTDLNVSQYIMRFKKVSTTLQIFGKPVCFQGSDVLAVCQGSCVYHCIMMTPDISVTPGADKLATFQRSDERRVPFQDQASLPLPGVITTPLFPRMFCCDLEDHQLLQAARSHWSIQYPSLRSSGMINRSTRVSQLPHWPNLGRCHAYHQLSMGAPSISKFFSFSPF